MFERLAKPARVTATILLAAAITTTGLGSTATPTPVSAAPADAPAVSLIGDSTMMAMGSYATASSDPRAVIGDVYDMAFSAESCRRLVNPSCRGRYGYVPASTLPLMRTTFEGRLGEAMVVMAGYDDGTISGAVDQIMAEAESQGVTRVFWLNYPTATRYVLPGGLPARDLYTSHNAALVDAAGRHPSLRVLDWDTYTNAFPQWFSADGIHLNRDGAFGLANYIKSALDADTSIGRCRASVALTGTPDAGTVAAALPTGGYGFVPREPERVLDTREATLGGANGKLGAGRTVAIDVDGLVPGDAVAAVLSVTAVDSCQPGFLTVFACGARPPTSNVNYEVGRTTAGLAIAPIADGKVCIYALTATDLVVDVMGSFTPNGQRFHPMTPTRWVDTRGGTATAATAVPSVVGEKTAITETQIPIRSIADVPAGATAVWLNLTVADPLAPTVLGVYPGPCGGSADASNVNARAQRSTASAVLVGLGGDGSVCVRTFAGRSHLVVDVAGWFGPGQGGLQYRLQEPSRLLDTRADTTPASDAEQRVASAGVSVLNVVAVDSADLGFVAVRPCGTSAVSSVLNTVTGENVANVAAVASDAGGQVCVDPSVTSDIVVDRVATFTP